MDLTTEELAKAVHELGQTDSPATGMEAEQPELPPGEDFHPEAKKNDQETMWGGFVGTSTTRLGQDPISGFRVGQREPSPRQLVKDLPARTPARAILRMSDMPLHPLVKGGILRHLFGQVSVSIHGSPLFETVSAASSTLGSVPND
jgi:hypothetical protein